MNYFSSIADTLIEAGHNVTVFIPEMNPNLKHPGSKKGVNIKYPPHPSATELLMNCSIYDNIWINDESPIEQLKVLENLFYAIYHQSLSILNDDNLMNSMKKEKFDFGIAEGLNLHAFGFFKAWGIKSYASATSTSIWSVYYKYFGMSFPSSSVPGNFNMFSKIITYTERIKNFFDYIFLYLYEIKIFELISLQNEFNKKYGDNFFDASNAIGDSSFMFTNSNPIINGGGPKAPKMIEIGGIALSEIKPLNKYWDNILSIRKINILISFGSMLKSSKMPISMKNSIINVVRRMPNVTFIWKYDNISENLGDNLYNLILKTWVPQYDIINDKRLTLLINHAGINSLFELAFSGTISLNIPVCNDQFSNAKVAENHGIGKTFSKDNFSDDDKLYEAIKDVLNDSKLFKNSQLMSKLLNRQSISAKELLVKNVEYGAEFGLLPQLDLKSRNMNFIEYHNLDIIFLLVFLFSIVTIIPMYFIIKFIFCNSEQKHKID